MHYIREMALGTVDPVVGGIPILYGDYFAGLRTTSPL